MLNSAERTQLIWNLERELEQLNSKLRRLAVSISVFSFEDVWNRAIAGKIDKSMVCLPLKQETECAEQQLLLQDIINLNRTVNHGDGKQILLYDSIGRTDVFPSIKGLCRRRRSACRIVP